MTATASVTDELASAARTVVDSRVEARSQAEVTALLYDCWYLRRSDPPGLPVGFPADLVQVFRAADAGTTRWEGGWRALRVDGRGRVIARRGRDVRAADRCSYLPARRPGTLPAAGDLLSLPSRRDRVDPDGSWWRTAGPGWSFVTPPPRLVRVWWNLRLSGVPRLVEAMTDLLAGEPRPWMVKCAARPLDHRRADAVVVYLRRDLLDDLGAEIDHLAALLEGDLQDDIPPMSLRVRAGVAAAVNPGGGESFGWHRCSIIAAALAGRLDGDDVEAATAAIRDELSSNGIDPDRPFATSEDAPLPWER